ncbi:AarF/ABC1/UbiB kinase family protein [Maribacter sp. TH_r10]|uniref:ABC1 kinase family protein n=1 Tax=Maribacter sp. TH_r10 TaxID=3082086 RepID=UPI002955B144|nr:AarF/ABC1/UbiB kinase family protein [Maribacter sp. TH_r10]MDV7139810.1 AarF/ABC1/UbiB kinase family protein [Maribacter sp. TH_r10]
MQDLKLSKNRKLKRYNRLFNVLAKYGFDQVLANSGIRRMFPEAYFKKRNEKTIKTESLSAYERIRMVLEELGPTYVKLGQIFSNREDMLPPALIKELEKLQDHVPKLKDFDVYEAIENGLKIKGMDHFIFIEAEPIAAASLAQVHKAQLLNGKLVALKIQRPNILETINADIAVMKQVAKSLEKYSAQAKAFQPMRIIATFEKSIHQELHFLREIDNMERFAKNFENNGIMYVPKVYREYSTDSIICMEFISGIKISETDTLKKWNIDCKSVGQVGVDLYLQQVLEHGFFHADPHPGNIFVLPEQGRICFIDYGMMGYLLPKDKEALEELLLYFTQKDIKKLIPVLEKIAVKTEIPDYTKLEDDLYDLVQSISDTSIRNIKLGETLSQFKSVLFRNNIILSHNLYLLIRALIIIEGVGLKLDPEFNITENLKPYVSQLARKKYSLKRLVKKNMLRFKDYNTLIDNLPEDINAILKKIKEGKLVVIHEHKGLKEFQVASNKAINRLVFAVIIAALSIGSSILVLAQMPPMINGVPLLGAIGFVISALLGFYVVISIFRNKQF